MKTQSDRLFLVAFFIIFLILAGSLFISIFMIRNRIDILQNEQNDYLPLSSGQVISQSFTSRHNFLDMVILNLKNPGLINRDEYQFLLKSEDGEKLFEQTFSGFNIGDPGQIRFQFSPIQDSKNKKFIFYLSPLKATTAENVGVAVKKGGIEGLDNILINGGAYYNGILSFSTLYRASNKVDIFATFFKELFYKFNQDRLFGFFWIFSIAVLILFYHKLK